MDNLIRIYRCKFISNGIILIVPYDRNVNNLSDGILYFSVSQIVSEVLYILYKFHCLRPLAHRASGLTLSTGPRLISLASGIGPAVNVADCIYIYIQKWLITGFFR